MEKNSPRRLYRSAGNRMIAGVFGGVGEYLDIDPTALRAVYVVATTLSGFIPLTIAYVLLVLIIPDDPQAAEQRRAREEQKKRENEAKKARSLKSQASPSYASKAGSDYYGVRYGRDGMSAQERGYAPSAATPGPAVEREVLREKPLSNVPPAYGAQQRTADVSPGERYASPVQSPDKSRFVDELKYEVRGSSLGSSADPGTRGKVPEPSPKPLARQSANFDLDSSFTDAEFLAEKEFEELKRSVQSSSQEDAQPRREEYVSAPAKQTDSSAAEVSWSTPVAERKRPPID